MADPMKGNRAVEMLDKAAKGGYGVLGVVSYNMETIVACMKAAEAKRSPIQILLFPWSLNFSPLLVHLAKAACTTASVPIALHFDHVQTEEEVLKAAEYTPDSIMVDMSHYEKEENLAKTKKLTAHLHSLGIATEAEPGRINGMEDGIADTGDLEGLLTTPEEAIQFVDTGIDFLAPAFGNIHGNYWGVENIKLDYPRLDSIKESITGRSNLVLHGTNTFPPEIMQKCIKGGMTRCNVNELVLHRYTKYVNENQGKVPLTTLLEVGTGLIQKEIEMWMDIIGSIGKADE